MTFSQFAQVLYVIVSMRVYDGVVFAFPLSLWWCPWPVSGSVVRPLSWCAVYPLRSPRIASTLSRPAPPKNQLKSIFNRYFYYLIISYHI